MPKKFAVENTKSVAAKARKAAAREHEKVQKQKEIEDAYWREDDKLILKKQQRKDEKERKKQEQLDKKAENRALMEEENKTLRLSAKQQSSAKLTQAQISADLDKKRAAMCKVATTKKVETHLSQPLEENINHSFHDAEVATNVTEAIAILSTKEVPVDKHPERRLKAAYAAFEEANMARFKAENPTVRLSQLKQIIWKEWLKSNENPLNQRNDL